MDGTNIMKDGNTLQVPVLPRAFPARQYPGYEAVYAHNRRFVEKDLNVSAHPRYEGTELADYNECGGSATWMYPDAQQVDRLNAVADFFSVWTFFDDLLDDSLDRHYIDACADRFADAVWGRPGPEPENRVTAEFFTRPDWTSDVHRLCTDEILNYLDVTRNLRTIEINQNPISTGRYLDLRARNVGMVFSHALIGYVMPSLGEELCAAAATGAYQAATRHCGASMAIMLDLYMINSGRAQMVKWGHIVPVIQRSTQVGSSRQEAFDAAVSLFHETEQQLAHELSCLSPQYPNAAAAVRDCHAGGMYWIERLRGQRYAAH